MQICNTLPLPVRFGRGDADPRMTDDRFRSDFPAFVPDNGSCQVLSAGGKSRRTLRVSRRGSNPREIVGEARNAGANNGGNPRRNTLRINKLRI